MTSVYARIDVSGDLKKLNGINEIVMEESVKMATEIAKFGEDEMKSNILASGTAFSQKARQAGVNKGPGRYRTGQMYDAVKSRVEAGPKSVRAAFGWLENVQDYFRYQENGFNNKFRALYSQSGALLTQGGQPLVERLPSGGGRPTKGMFALRDARLTVLNELPRFTRKYQGIITRRANKLK